MQNNLKPGSNNANQNDLNNGSIKLCANKNDLKLNPGSKCANQNDLNPKARLPTRSVCDPYSQLFTVLFARSVMMNHEVAS